MNKKVLIGGAIGLIVVMAIVLAIIFLGKGKETADNQINKTVDDTINELKDYTDLSEDQMREELNTVVDLGDREDLQSLLDSLEEPVIAELLPDDENTPLDSTKYYGKDADGNIIEVVSPYLAMSEEEAQELADKLLEAAEAVGDEEEYGRLILEAEDLVPILPPEDLIDQDLINIGFEADIDPETGEINYWNPNTVDDGEPDDDYDPSAHRVDPNTQSAQDAGYKPIDPSHIIYGN